MRRCTLCLVVTLALAAGAAAVDLKKPERTEAKPADMATPAPDAAQISPWATGMTEEESINKMLTAEVGSLAVAGKKAEALEVVARAEALLRQYIKTSDIPEYDPEIAKLFQMIASKRNVLQPKSSTDPKPTTAVKFTREQIKLLAECRKALVAAEDLLDAKKPAEAQEKVDAVMKAMDGLVSESQVPAWNRAIAPIFQNGDELQGKIDAATEKTEKKGKPGSAGLKVGDSAPPFSVTKLDGKPLSSKDLAGKWVLLDFWATWCGPCRGEMPHLQQVQDAFGKEPNFVAVSLSIDNTIDKPRDYVQKNKLTWTHGFLGQSWQAPLLKKYGVRGIPAIFLINPYGKIVRVSLRGEGMKQAVAKALGKPWPAQ